MSEIPNINISNLEDLESKRCASTRNIDISFNLLIFFFYLTEIRRKRVLVLL